MLLKNKEEKINKYNVFIYGAGNQSALADALNSGNEHKIISFAHAFSKHSGFNLLGFYDTDMKKGAEASIIWKTDYYSGFPFYADIDVIVIATSDDSHYKLLKKILDRKLKPKPRLVICEKPLCMNIDQCKEIVELYKTKGIPLMVNYTRRFLPYYIELKRLYDLGLFGEIQNCSLVFNRGWEHTATHGIDVFNWFFGDNIKPNIVHCENAIDRIWFISMDFQNYFWSEQRVGNKQPVWEYYDFSHWYIAENAYNFLQGYEPIRCTGEQALYALEKCLELKNEY